MLLPQESFKNSQLKKSRVKSAYEEKEKVIKKYFTDKKVEFEGFQMFIRAFKLEGKLEVWVKEKSKTTYSLLHTYDFCATSGTLGPKRKEGDLQIPEGIYHINHFNPESSFHLSMGINYPNESERILSDKKYPGSAIYIHGNCATIGCIPITDDKIKELYVLGVEAKNNGQDKIPVHIFPTKLNDGNLKLICDQIPVHKEFWTNLKLIFDNFDKNKTLQTVNVDKTGKYFIATPLTSN